MLSKNRWISINGKGKASLEDTLNFETRKPGNRVAILQSNYIPWKGYFDIINRVDLFIFHDDLQYTKGDWRNRNKIKTPNGPIWLTIPCGTSEKRLICEVGLNDPSWQKNHWARIRQNYRKAPFFNEYKEFFEELYMGHSWSNLSEMNQHMIKKMALEIFGMTTKFEDSRKYNLTMSKMERVMELLTKANATYYLSGPAAKNYLKNEMFEKAGIELVYLNYDGYSEYEQLFPPFDHYISVLDLIFSVGAQAKDHLISNR